MYIFSSASMVLCESYAIVELLAASARADILTLRCLNLLSGSVPPPLNCIKDRSPVLSLLDVTGKTTLDPSLA